MSSDFVIVVLLLYNTKLLFFLNLCAHTVVLLCFLVVLSGFFFSFKSMLNLTASCEMNKVLLIELD